MQYSAAAPLSLKPSISLDFRRSKVQGSSDYKRNMKLVCSGFEVCQTP
ncbi:unnamed protein product [Rhodiola kirilowii]